MWPSRAALSKWTAKGRLKMFEYIFVICELNFNSDRIKDERLCKTEPKIVPT